MSDWTKIRDSIEDAIKLDAVGKTMKNDFVCWLGNEGIEFAQKFVDRIIDECKTDAPTETGWCKIRDAFVVPVVLNIAMYVLKMVLAKANAENNQSLLAEYASLYEQNADLTGWLRIDDTLIDYPVMQRSEDENYYLQHDFYGADNIYGCLVLDNDSHAGNGTKQQDYADGTKPSTNLIVHGHMTKTGEMFGNLNLYRDKEYGLSHSIIYFDTLYEKREYQLISAFYSQVYYQNDDVFKYYKFFQADTQEEFDYWYDNIKQKSLYDTGVTAEFGDEFITLSCCSYHMTDGRFVVVAKRIK